MCAVIRFFHSQTCWVAPVSPLKGRVHPHFNLLHLLNERVNQDGWMDKNGWMDRWTDGLMDGWILLLLPRKRYSIDKTHTDTGGNWSTLRESTWTRGEHANAALLAPWESNLQTSCCEAIVLCCLQASKSFGILILRNSNRGSQSVTAGKSGRLRYQ